jgi:hypothetical protein
MIQLSLPNPGGSFLVLNPYISSTVVETSNSCYPQVYGVRAITTGPSRIESTSLVFVYGVDLFLGSVTPSQPFDILSSSFNKAQLLTTISGLSLAIMIARPIVSRHLFAVHQLTFSPK